MDEYLTAGEAAARLGVIERTIHRAIARRELAQPWGAPAAPSGFAAADLERFRARRGPAWVGGARRLPSCR